MRSSSLFGQKVYSLIIDYAPALQRERERQKRTVNETGCINCLIHDHHFAYLPLQGEEDHFKDDYDDDVGGDLYGQR